MEKFNIEDDLVLLIDKRVDTDKFVIAKAITKEKLRWISHKNDIQDCDKFFFITGENAGQEILDKHNFDIVGVDSSYFEHDDMFYISLENILTASSLSCEHYVIENLSNTSIRSHQNQTYNFLKDFLCRNDFRKFPEELTTQNIKYIEDKLNFELENVNNKFDNENEFSL